MENPNEYNDADYLAATAEIPKIATVLEKCWEAGAEVDDIQQMVTDALSDAGSEFTVELGRDA